MATDKVISTLNDLIQTCRNGEEGFREAAEHDEDPIGPGRRRARYPSG